MNRRVLAWGWIALLPGVLGCEGAAVRADPSTRLGEDAAVVRWVAATEARGAMGWEVPAVVRVDGGGAGVVTASVRVRVVAVRTTAGDRVEAGQVVAEVEAPEVLRALGNRAAAAGRMGPMRQWRSELQAHRDAGFIRLTELREVEARFAEVEAALRVAESEVRASGFGPADLDTLHRTGRVALRAPVAGVVRSVAMTVGRVVDPGDPPLASIAGPRPARVELRLHDPWPTGATLRFEPIHGPGVPLDPTPLSETVDPDTGARLLWLQPQGEVSLVAGATGRVVVSGLPPDAVEVPARALLRHGGGARVLVRQGASTRPQPVTVLSLSAHTALVRGIRPGVEVAAEADRLEAR